MSPPELGVEGGGQGNVCLVASSTSTDSMSQTGFKERNYLGLSDCSSVDSSVVSSLSEVNRNNLNLNLKATELRLGLPGSQSPERDPEFNPLSSVKFDEKPLFPLLPSKDGICSSSQKTIVSGNKRGFSDTMDGLSEKKGSLFAEGNWMINTTGSDPETPKSKFSGSSAINVMLSSGSSKIQLTTTKEGPAKASQEQALAPNATSHSKMNGLNNNGSAPAAKHR